MAQRFVEQATKQLNPVYQKQIKAAQAQIPGIDQYFDTLVTGLEGQRQAETQNILESAGSRGVLRSTLPVDAQQELGKALLARRGEIDLERSQQMGAVNERVGQLGLQRLSAISELADSLQRRDLMERQFALEKENARAAARAASAAQAQSGALNALIAKAQGGGQPTQATNLPGVKLKDTKLGGKAGFSFSFGGQPVSAYTYSRANGVNMADLLYSMAQQGDSTASKAYLDIVRNNGTITNEIRNRYSALFWQPQTRNTTAFDRRTIPGLEF